MTVICLVVAAQRCKPSDGDDSACFASKSFLLHLLHFSKSIDAEGILEVKYLSMLVEVKIKYVLKTNLKKNNKNPTKTQKLNTEDVCNISIIIKCFPGCGEEKLRDERRDGKISGQLTKQH